MYRLVGWLVFRFSSAELPSFAVATFDSVHWSPLLGGRDEQTLDVAGRDRRNSALPLHPVGWQNLTSGSQLLHFDGGAGTVHFLAVSRVKPLRRHRFVL
jgi:hypothetical protein